ncbi:phage integrase family protein [Luminiphilus syltensis NOR5-1B]|uniref:Phage integrase family protein n=1 Tax=Luminiphilus syltensis NOR5-1B TaxID=565045 RepID=B8KVN4_9GAMM|nr:phage integrase family protein [Luminiphilus syltensis]EED35769.1 phage integrase family protein [Luminiphilus syltensis NOR5-1B]
MNDEIALGNGKNSYSEYIQAINLYLIPTFKHQKITSIDEQALQELNAKRAAIMQKAPTRSTIASHNAALNKVFDEAVIRGFLTSSNRPPLKAVGVTRKRRPDFSLEEINLLLEGIEEWIAAATKEKSLELRQLLGDYIELLLDTGARPGVELMQLKWNQIKYHIAPETEKTSDAYTAAELGEEGVDALSSDEYDNAQKQQHDINAHLEINVSGKTGRRTIIANKRSIKALTRIARRNFSGKGRVLHPLSHVIRADNEHYVIRTKTGIEPTSFAKLFDSLL